MSVMELPGSIWSLFYQKANARLNRLEEMRKPFALSEETLRLDFMLTLLDSGVSSTEVYPEFPYDKNMGHKADLFIDRGPGAFLEVKFYRQIPSGKNPPYTQHYGSLLSDVIKLVIFPAHERERFLVLILDNHFYRYFQGKEFFPGSESKRQKIALNNLPKTAMNEIEKRIGQNVPNEIEYKLIVRNWFKNRLNFFLIEVDVKG